MADIGRKSIGIFVFALILTAGFSVFWMSAPAQDETTAAIEPEPATGTPAESSNETPPFPPGTSESGIDNATLLLEVHLALLENTTYEEWAEWDEIDELTDENQTFQEFEVSSFTVQAKQGTNGSHVTLEIDNSTTVYWTTDEALAVKSSEQELPSETYIYNRGGAAAKEVNGTQHPFVGVLSRQIVFPYLRGVEYEYEGTVTRDNRTFHEFTSTGINETAQDEPGGLSSSVANVNATLLIDQDGIVRSFNVSETRSRDNETMTTNTTYSVQQTGNVSPTAPEWVSNELPHLNVSLSDNGTLITVEHTGGMSVSTASLMVYSSNATAYAELNKTVNPGDSVYLYRTADAPDQLKVSTNERPETNESVLTFDEADPMITVHRLSGTDESYMMIEVEFQNDSATGIAVPTFARINDRTHMIYGYLARDAPDYYRQSSLIPSMSFGHDVIGITFE